MGRPAATFGQLAETETAWVGRAAGATLTTSGTWNRGLGLLLAATAPNGETSEMHYDGFGRPVAAVPPPVEGCPDDLPTTLIRYELTPAPTVQPLSRVLTTTIIRSASCGTDHPIEGIAYVDGLGRPRAALATGDDGHAWVRSGITTFDQKGTVRRTYQPDFFDGDPNTFASVVALPSGIPYAVTRYDAFGRARGVIAEDGATVWTSHHALSTDVCDPLDNDHASPHYRTCTTARVDGHGRVIDQILRNRHPDTGTEEHYRLWSWYRQDGAVLALARTQQNAAVVRPAAPPTPGPTTVVRTFAYDSVGRRWTSADPDTDSREAARTSANRSWRYLFNTVGDLAAVRDPRGCGQNFFYDLGGRLVGEQYVGCTEAASSADERPVADLPAGMLSLTETTGTLQVDVRYHYDTYADLGWSDTERPLDDDHLALGLPTGVEDRGQRSALSYDRRGNAVWSARQMALISAPPPLAPVASPNDAPRRTETVATGFVAYDEEHTYVRTATFDHAARPTSMTLPRDPDASPASVEDVGGSLTYNRRGLPQTATATIGAHSQLVVAGIQYDRDGAVLRTTWGDARPAIGDEDPGHAASVSETRYDRRRRPIRFITTRDPTGSAPQTLAAVSTVVDQELVWDAASNLTDIVDHRDGSEWPDGFRPRTTHVDHDSLYRVVGAYFEYTQEDNRVFPSDTASDYRDTLASIRQAGADPMETRPAEMLPTAPPSRAEALEWSYDFLGNSTEWSDDADSFYERSIGAIANGAELGTDLRPSALYFATNIRSPLSTTEGNAGWLELEYGEGGNVTSMTVRAQCGPRAGHNLCTPGSSTDQLARRDSLRATCACQTEQQYEYRWDELNRLAEARRWDRTAIEPAWTLKVRQRYRYDGANQRTVKQTLSEDGQGGTLERIALYVLPGDFERRGLVRGAVQYEPSGTGTETQYLVAGARLVWKHDPLDPNAHQNRRLTVPLTDIIQTTAATLDLISGDLLEASTYYPNGARETLWADTSDPSAAEPMGFTSKEADEEVGLVYFGERYLIPRIGRWASPDPLHVHAGGGGESLNSYHYLSGNLLQSRDPIGLDEGAGWRHTGPDGGDPRAHEYVGSDGVHTMEFIDPVEIDASPYVCAADCRPDAPQRPPPQLRPDPGGELLADIIRRAQEQWDRARRVGSSLFGAWAANIAWANGADTETALEVGDAVAGLESVGTAALATGAGARARAGQGSPPQPERRSPREPDLSPTAGAAARTRARLPHARGINPGYPTSPGRDRNCPNCAISLDATLDGRPMVALPGRPASMREIADAIGIDPAAWSRVAYTTGRMRQEVQAMGEGAQGIVFAIRERDGSGLNHVFNFVHRGGVIQFLDGQTGGQADLRGYQGGFYLLRTDLFHTSRR